MAKGKFLEELLKELGLDRAVLQVLDEPYLKDMATKFKETEAIQKITNKLDEDEGIFGWMDYEQLMDLRERILPELLIKHSNLDKPNPTLGGELGSTFDDQFESIFGKKKFNKGGDYVDWVEMLSKDDQQGYVLWEDMDRGQKDLWREAMKKKYGEDYVPYPKRSYWNVKNNKWQNEPVTEEQYRKEPWIHKQQRDPEKQIPGQTWGESGVDMWNWLGLDIDEIKKGNLKGDEVTYQRNLYESVIPGITTMPFWDPVLSTFMGDAAKEYYRNQEDFTAKTGITPTWKQSMGLGMGVGFPLGYLIDRYGIGSLLKMNKNLWPLMKEGFPLTFGDKGPFSKSNWYKSAIRNPLQFMKMHVPGKTGGKAWSQVLNPTVKALLPKVAQRYGIAAVPYVGQIAALGLGAYDTYRLINWLLDDSDSQAVEYMEDKVSE